MLYFKQFPDFERFFDSKRHIYPENHLQKEILQNILPSHQNFGRYFLSLFSIFKDQFWCGMVNQRNFLHVVDLWFDARFVNYYRLSLPYHKQCPIDNMWVKCLQIGQKLSGYFLNTFFVDSLEQIERISDFIILVIELWFLITTANFINEWELINS